MEKKMNIKKIILLLIIGALLFTACASQENEVPFIRPTDDTLVEPAPPVNDEEPDADVDLIEGNAYVNQAQLFIMESYPVQVSVNVIGDLPTPCHYFRSIVNPPNDKNEILIGIYSEVEPTKVCIDVLEPFDENVSLPLDNIPDGVYSVFVNGEWVGEFSYPG